MLRMTLLAVSSLTFFAGCSADDEEDDIDQASSSLLAATVPNVEPVSVRRCTALGGTISKRPAEVSADCKQLGYGGDVCRAPNPKYDASLCSAYMMSAPVPAAQQPLVCRPKLNHCVK